MTSVSALEILKNVDRAPTFLSFGCPLLDNIIGGVPTQGITEISGEAGCGKTQLCLTLALQAQLNSQNGGMNGSTAYVSCGEGTFPIRRLSQLAMQYESKTGVPNQLFLSKVLIEHCYNSEDAQEILKHKIPELCRNQGVKLLVIDSLAGLIRFEYDNKSSQDMKLRTILLFNIAKQLKLLSDIFKICVVVVNQVKSDFQTQQVDIHSNSSVPALGLAWSHCVNTRITLHRDSTDLRTVGNPMATMNHDIDNINNNTVQTSYSNSHNYYDHNNNRYSNGSNKDYNCNIYNLNDCSNNMYYQGTKCNANDKYNSLIGLSKRISYCSEILPKIQYAVDDVNEDILAENNNGTEHSNIISSPSKRYMSLEFSSYHASVCCAYEIRIDGVFGL